MTARGRKRRKRDYEKEMECVGRSLARHLVLLFILQKYVAQRCGESDASASVPSLYTAGAANVELTSQSVLLAAVQNESTQLHNCILTET